MQKQNIVLTGFMGTGKSTIGRLLAKRIDYHFVDTDKEIENRCGKSVADIFQQDGEAFFRQQEEKLVRELAKQPRQVISTGGGLLMNPQNIEVLVKNSQIICLTASPDEILERVSKQPLTRPLLKETDPRKKVIQLLEQRSSVYAQFDQLATSGKSPEELVNILLERLESS